MPKKKVPAPSGLKMRPDGRYQRTVLIGKKRHTFYGRTEEEIFEKIINYKEKEEKGKTFEEVADEWYWASEPQLEYNTYSHYKAHKNILVEHFKDEYIKDITIADINRFVLLCAAQGFAKKTVSNRLSVLKLIFKHAMVYGYIESDPCTYISIPKHLPQQRRELPSDEQIELINNSINCTFGLFAYFLLYTGLRRGEALALTYGDIDRKNKVIHVTKSVYNIGNNPHVKQPKTEAGNRDVVLLDCLARVLPLGHKNSIVFANQDGQYIHNSHFTRLWKKYQEESGVTITPHQLRHAYATILFNAGLADKDAQELMGHSNISVTRDIYTHISKSRKDTIRDKLNEYTSSQKTI